MKVLAVASSGGHWVQLLRVLAAFEGAEIVFVSVDEHYREEIPSHRFHVVNDANRWDRLGTVKLAFQMLRIVLLERPCGRLLDRGGARVLRGAVRSPAPRQDDLARQHRERREHVDVRQDGASVCPAVAHPVARAHGSEGAGVLREGILIFITVGGQVSFDRLIRGVDMWAQEAGRDDLFAQIGDGEYAPRHIEWTRFLSPAEFRTRAQAASAIVAHAGMGTILTALELGKPILVFPRRAQFREHRNDHQLASARRFGDLGYVLVAWEPEELAEGLVRVEHHRTRAAIQARASESLLQRVREFSMR